MKVECEYEKKNTIFKYEIYFLNDIVTCDTLFPGQPISAPNTGKCRMFFLFTFLLNLHMLIFRCKVVYI